jgi:hypothetical protein
VFVVEVTNKRVDPKYICKYMYDIIVLIDSFRNKIRIYGNQGIISEAYIFLAKYMKLCMDFLWLCT